MPTVGLKSQQALQIKTLKRNQRKREEEEEKEEEEEEGMKSLRNAKKFWLRNQNIF